MELIGLEGNDKALEGHATRSRSLRIHSRRTRSHAWPATATAPGSGRRRGGNPRVSWRVGFPEARGAMWGRLPCDRVLQIVENDEIGEVVPLTHAAPRGPSVITFGTIRGCVPQGGCGSPFSCCSTYASCTDTYGNGFGFLSWTFLQLY